MNPQQFSELVKDPSKIGNNELPALSAILKQYPYFQSAHLLYSLGLQRNSAEGYEQQLKKTVVYSGDRRRLKELLEGVKSDVTAVPAPAPVQPETVKALEAEAVVPEAVSEKEPAEIYIEESVVSANELEVVSPEGSTGKDVEAQSHSSLHELKSSSAVPKEKLTQEDLLAIVRRRLAEIQSEKTASVSGPGSVGQGGSENLQEKAPAGDVGRKTSKESIIDKFIQDEPKITRPRKEFFSPTSSAHKSNMDEEDIVSETLARLYARQGNLQKAIHIYEKLSLQFSEKSRYFAAQIESLKGDLPRSEH
jgi:tetratricopeptide (TPR) repeat protein